jgi:tryptophanyl-tRNA synthetase
MKEIVFDERYYNLVMKEFGYSPMEFEPISFSLGGMCKEDLQRQWLCHVNGRTFADAMDNGKRVVATTGFGLSGVPHMGTLSQILRAIRLQRSGIPVQVVLGDLDAFNGKNVPIGKAKDLADSYRQFILDLGFNQSHPNSLRNQYDCLSTLRLSYLIGHYMDDEMFDQAEEDLHDFYSQRGRVDSSMSYRRKLSLNLMIADFLELLQNDFDAVMVILGIDEHRYVDFGRKVLEKAVSDFAFLHGKHYAAMYSGIIRGFHGYPKMSKSFTDSGITVDMSTERISELIDQGESVTPFPESNVVYQLISSVSLYGNDQIQEAYEECRSQSARWRSIKRDYAEHLYCLCRLWPAS